MDVVRAMPLLTVTDLDATLDAYVQVTGMEVVMNHGWIATLAPAGDSSAQLSLITTDPTGPVNPSASIEVDDVDSAYRAAVDADLEIVYEITNEEWGVRRFFFRDAGGNVVNVLAHM
ncbi:glyoxalase [Rhodococcoides fascians A21d2]|uniref:VOC family protein n=1 Tax=Nocardiaceae TaxID=85025 RepID=UPI00055AB6FF|nr:MULTISPECIES: VOC family protein [Rhodococcus]QIH98785.1 glyoxalase [Rhodococcus fascians A21d2]QII04227.1 glyoxalase [Rhodococcus fascians A25f]